MGAKRQDAWKQDEDLLLAEVVLRHIREGGTQLSAFEEVGKRLSRTASACGFRWNSFVRKQYKTGIELAKKQRKEKNNSKSLEDKAEVRHIEQKNSVERLNISNVINYLQLLEGQSQRYEDIAQENEELVHRINQLESKLKELEVEKETLLVRTCDIKEDYKTLLTIIERARKLYMFVEKS
ncbi:RsfA family transcriptional regulator [Bacillus sp. SCS-151]|uniref:RsfA family transcriptional regulator n=1 Tax=Nanhaiella sioensis TaxID=3115293 RepID=UPI00397E781E